MHLVGNVYITGIALDKLRVGTYDNLWQEFGGIIIGLFAFMIGQLVFEYISVRSIWTLEASVMKNLGAKVYN